MLDSEGIVKWFNPDKYGFIKVDDGREVIVFPDGVQDGLVLTEGMAVKFHVVPTPKGGKAVNVRELGGGASPVQYGSVSYED